MHSVRDDHVYIASGEEHLITVHFMNYCPFYASVNGLICYIDYSKHPGVIKRKLFLKTTSGLNSEMKKTLKPQPERKLLDKNGGSHLLEIIVSKGTRYQVVYPLAFERQDIILIAILAQTSMRLVEGVFKVVMVILLLFVQLSLQQFASLRLTYERWA